MDNPGDRLNLPVSRETPLPKKRLSMNEYEKFNEEELAHGVDREAYMREKRRREVNVMFILDKRV